MTALERFYAGDYTNCTTITNDDGTTTLIVYDAVTGVTEKSTVRNFLKPNEQEIAVLPVEPVPAEIIQRIARAIQKYPGGKNNDQRGKRIGNA